MAFVFSAYSKNGWRSAAGHCTTEPIIYHVNEAKTWQPVNEGTMIGVKCPVCGEMVLVPWEGLHAEAR